MKLTGEHVDVYTSCINTYSGEIRKSVQVAKQLVDECDEMRKEFAVIYRLSDQMFVYCFRRD